MTEPTDAEIIALADETRTAEGGASGYILPISFARAVLAKWGSQPVGAQPAPQQEAASVDLKTMELAESVGLIGPASRTNDLHAAIQRFHDLICANATIKAAAMAVEVISGVSAHQWDTGYPPLPKPNIQRGGPPNLFTEDQMRAYVDADRAARAPADSVLEDEARLERERICAAIKAEDDYCVDRGGYMLDSDDCIKIVRGEWVRPDFSVAAARKQGGAT